MEKLVLNSLGLMQGQKESLSTGELGILKGRVRRDINFLMTKKKSGGYRRRNV